MYCCREWKRKFNFWGINHSSTLPFKRKIVLPVSNTFAHSEGSLGNVISIIFHLSIFSTILLSVMNCFIRKEYLITGSPFHIFSSWYTRLINDIFSFWNECFPSACSRLSSACARLPSACSWLSSARSCLYRSARCVELYEGVSLLVPLPIFLIWWDMWKLFTCLLFLSWLVCAALLLVWCSSTCPFAVWERRRDGNSVICTA